MKVVTIINTVALILVAAACMAQPAGTINVDKYLQAAGEASMTGNHFEAVSIGEEAYKETGDPRFMASLAKSYFSLRDYGQAIKWGEMYSNSNPESIDLESQKCYAAALKATGRYQDAIEVYDSLLGAKGVANADMNNIKLQVEGAELAIDASPAKGVSVSNIGSKINGVSSEYSPFLLADGTLYYSALSNTEAVGLEDGAAYSTKIYRADANFGTYDTPVTLTESINSEDHFQSNVSISRDGKKMAFARQKVSGEGRIISSQLFMSTYKNGKWSKPKAMHGQNSDLLYKSPSFGKYEGKDVVFFIAKDLKLPSSYDIYYAALSTKGKISNPKKLGLFVNTSYDEESPFYQDGDLYFSSKGHAGYGGYDIFKADLKSKKVINMGSPYNSPADDLYFMMADDFSGVFVSNRADASSMSLQAPTCCNDIYKVELANIQLSPMVVDLETGDEIKDGVIVVKDSNGREITTIAGKTNLYQLAPDMDYTVTVTREGYEDLPPLQLTTKGLYNSDIISKELELTPIKVEPEPVKEVITVAEPIVLEEILFDYREDKILDEALGDLNYLLKIMRTYPDIKIRVSSHTDSRGGKDYNQKLSLRRSSSVRNWLVSNGVDQGRIEAVGLGSNRPLNVYQAVADKYTFLEVGNILDDTFIDKLSKDDQEICHQLNRRSEFEITEGPKVILKKK